MPFLKTNFNLCVFDVEEFKQDRTVVERLIERKFTELTPSQESGHGWVLIDDQFRSDFEPENTFVVDYVTAGYRYDKKTVPAALVKKRFKDKLAQRIKEEGKVSKSDKKLLKEEARIELIMKALPVPKNIEWIWDFQKNLIYLDSKSGKVIDKFMELFTETFGISLSVKEYGLDTTSLDNFLDWVWSDAKNEKGFWIYDDVVLDEDKNTFKFNGPDLENHLEDINNLKKNKKVQQLSIGVEVNENQKISFMLNNKNTFVSVKNPKKIKHESVETAVLDNGDIINSVIKTVEKLVSDFLGV